MDPERSREQYRECMRNHAAKLGTYAVDGCGEYTPDPSNPGGLQCAACGCHRNFHRKYMALEPGVDSMAVGLPSPTGSDQGREGRRRTRTKFSSEQKEKMLQFAEKIGWRMQRRDGGDDNEITMFCQEIGVTRQVFKVWMHNHKNSSAASSSTNTTTKDDHDSSKGNPFD